MRMRAELLVRMVMPTIVPVSEEHPFHYWLRFEEGPSGNPHAHGMAYAAKNPEFEVVVATEEDRERLQAEGCDAW